MCVACVQCLQEPEEALDPLGLEWVQVVVSHLCGRWNLNLGSLSARPASTAPDLFLIRLKPLLRLCVRACACASVNAHKRQQDIQVSTSITFHLAVLRQDLPLNWKLAVLVGLASQRGPWNLPAPTCPMLEVRHTQPHPAFYVDAGDMNSGFHACKKLLLPTIYIAPFYSFKGRNLCGINLTEAKVIWAEKTQLRKCLLKISSGFSKKAGWASQMEQASKQYQ